MSNRRKAPLKSLIHSLKERKVLSKNKIVTFPLRQHSCNGGNMSCFLTSHFLFAGALKRAVFPAVPFISYDENI
jgi:hypothetical protein